MNLATLRIWFSFIFVQLGFFEILWDSLGPLEFLGIFKDSLRFFGFVMFKYPIFFEDSLGFFEILWDF